MCNLALPRNVLLGPLDPVGSVVQISRARVVETLEARVRGRIMSAGHWSDLDAGAGRQRTSRRRSAAYGDYRPRQVGVSS
jgi:hypothetical protein